MNQIITYLEPDLNWFRTCCDYYTNFLSKPCSWQVRLMKGKEKKIWVFISPIAQIYIAYSSQRAQAWITQFYLQITPCLPFLRKLSPDGATPDWTAYIQLQLTTHLSTSTGWKAELAWLAERTVYPHKWSPVSYSSSRGQGEFAGQRPMFHHCATPQTNTKQKQ